MGHPQCRAWNATAIILLWSAGGVIVLIDAMNSVELAASIRRSSHRYVFAARAFGPFISLAVGLTVQPGEHRCDC